MIISRLTGPCALVLFLTSCGRPPGLLPQTGPPQRIISVVPNVTEMLFAFGLGDKVIAVITKDSKINIHREDCRNLIPLESSKKLKASWKELNENKTILTVTVTDRMGVLADILNTIASQKINVVSINSVIKKDKADIIVEVNYKTPGQIDGAILGLKQVRSVVNVRKK